MEKMHKIGIEIEVSGADPQLVDEIAGKLREHCFDEEQNNYNAVKVTYKSKRIGAKK